jgi:deoxyribose-phosphate aldolase
MNSTYLSILKPEALSAEVHYIVTEAMQKSHAGVIVTPVWVGRVAAMLRGSGVRVGTVVGFPHGTSKATLKAIESTSSLKDGADELFVSMHLLPLIGRDFDAARGELLEIVRAARATRRDAVINVIVEAPLLLALGPGRAEDSIAIACRAVRESGCDGVVTASGYHRAGGASTAAVESLKKHAEGIAVTAMGGIANVSVANAFLSSGADRAVIDPSS